MWKQTLATESTYHDSSDQTKIAFIPSCKMSSSIEFLQVNLQKAKQAQIKIGQNIRSLNKKNGNFVCLIQEPQVYKNCLAGQPITCKRYSIQQNPRTAIYTDSNIQIWFIEALSTRDITVVQTMVNKKSTLLISAYLDITLIHVISPALHKVLRYAEDKDFGVILGMDTNAHSTSFGPVCLVHIWVVHCILNRGSLGCILLGMS